jgi:signal transduction histidine kinase
MNPNVFHNASVKLSAIYLLIIMAISLVFSFGLYRVTSQEVVRGIRRQDGPIGILMRNPERFPQEIVTDIINDQEVAIDNSLRKIRANLLLINMFIFVSGGLLSYYFARRTLAPIEKAHEAQSRFAADASHELRTPLTAMKLETEITLTEPDLTLKQAEAQLRSNLEELDKLTTLSENLLKLARLDSEQTPRENVPLKDMLVEAIDRVQVISDSKEQTIELKPVPKVSVVADQIMLTEAFVTLLDNAVKYTAIGGRVWITAQADNKVVKVHVHDNGQGIIAEDLPHIFERFYRADDSRTDSHNEGYGIGLSIAKTAVEAHGGTIRAQSSEGEGSVFTVALPIAR